MFFTHYRTILFVNKEKIRWAKGQTPGGKILGLIQELPWSEKNLRSALENIAARFPKKIRLVAGEEFSYVSNFPKGGKNNSTIDEAQALIPEKLQDGWDSCDGQSNNVQVMAVQQEFFSALKKAFLEVKLTAEVIEAESISISRMIPKSGNEAVLAARYDEKILLEVVQNGLVLATKIFFQLPEKEKIQEFLDYILNQKNITLAAVYIEDQAGDLRNIFQSLNFKVQEKALSPMAGICRKKDISGRDEKVLNIFLGKATSEKKIKSDSPWRKKIILAAFLLVLLGGIAAVYFINKSRQKTVKKTPSNGQAQKDQAGLKWEE